MLLERQPSNEVRDSSNNKFRMFYSSITTEEALEANFLKITVIAVQKTYMFQFQLRTLV